MHSRCWWRILSFLSASAMAVSVLVASGQPAMAAHSPCGVRSNPPLIPTFMDGYITTSSGPQSWFGASANIVVRPGASCPQDTSQTNFSIAWSMIQENANTGHAGYAQSGFFQSPGTAIFDFVEYNVHCCTGYTRVFGPTVANGQQHQYWEDYLVGQNAVSLNVDSTALARTNFNPATSWVTPFQANWDGETYYVESDMPGTSTATTRFSNLQTELGTGAYKGFGPGGLFTTINPLHTCSCYHQDTPATQTGLGTVFDIWTNPITR